MNMLNYIRLVICENGIIPPYVRDVPKVDLAADFFLKLHTFHYSVYPLIRVEGPFFWRFFMFRV